MSAQVIAVSSDAKNNFSKINQPSIRLIEGLGVDGDAHYGKTVQHIYLVKKDPTAPNLRQVHLMHAELFDELADQGFEILPGDIGENITTRGIDLLGLPTGARLTISDTVIEVTGLRMPCKQLDDFQKGLTKAVLDKDADGHLIIKSGVMGIVVKGGEIRAGDEIVIKLPTQPHRSLSPV